MAFLFECFRRLFQCNVVTDFLNIKFPLKYGASLNVLYFVHINLIIDT